MWVRWQREKKVALITLLLWSKIDNELEKKYISHHLRVCLKSMHDICFQSLRWAVGAHSIVKVSIVWNKCGIVSCRIYSGLPSHIQTFGDDLFLFMSMIIHSIFFSILFHYPKYRLATLNRFPRCPNTVAQWIKQTSI